MANTIASATLPNLMALLMRRELDKEGHFQIRWGEQMIA